MAYFLFLDESGQDRRFSPYEVLAGVAIQDVALWDLVQRIRAVEIKYFGNFYRADKKELKAKNLLKRKTFRLAGQLAPIDEGAVCKLAQDCLADGPNAKLVHLTALAQAKLRYVNEVFRLCQTYDCRIFGSIIDYQAIAAQPELTDFVHMSYLRKDYAYLFERFFYFLEDLPTKEMGVVVFDELEKSKSHILHGQMHQYFQHTLKGQERSNLIVPEPLFVHSDLTTGVQIADLVAYCLAWNFRVRGMKAEKREELSGLVDLISSMRYLAKRVIPDIHETEFAEIWSIAVINS